jgi:hypothetical protein
LSSKPIQEQFGERVMEAFADFARADLKPPAQLQGEDFAHVSDPTLRRRLADVFYGARWIYKLGLALLTRDEERGAHVRAQIVDYASVAEGLLSHCIAHAVRNGYVRGSGYEWDDPDRQQRPLRWNRARPEIIINKRSFWWLIRIARDFGIVDTGVEGNLQWLRNQRNAVHLRQRSSLGKIAFLNQSKQAFDIVLTVIRQTQRWKAAHP